MEANAFLFAEGEALGEPGREAGIENFLLCGGDIVFQAAKLNSRFIDVVDDISGFGIIVARLADSADVDEIFLTGLDFEFRIRSAANHAVADESDGDVRVAEETNASVLVGETGGGGQFVENVAPALGTIERSVDNGEAGDHANVFEIAQPLAIIFGELFAGPVDGFGRGRIEAIERLLSGAVVVMISLNAGNVHAADNIEAFLGIGIIANDIPETCKMGAFLLFNVLQNNLERFKIGVDVRYDRKLHASI